MKLRGKLLVQLSNDGGKTWEDTDQSLDDEALAQNCVEYYNRTDRGKRKYRVVPNKG